MVWGVVGGDGGLDELEELAGQARRLVHARFGACAAHELTQLLRVGAWIFVEEFGLRLVVGQQNVAPAFQRMHARHAGTVVVGGGGNDGAHRIGICRAHELADVERLPLAPAVRSDALGFEHGIAQGVGQGGLAHGVCGQTDELLAELLQREHVALDLAFARGAIVWQVVRGVDWAMREFHGSYYPLTSSALRSSPIPDGAWRRHKEFHIVGRFAYSKSQFQDLAQQALDEARKAGATDAQVEVSEGQGMSVGVRSGQIENVEHNRDKSLSISVFDGQRRGHASTSDFSAQAIARTAKAAFDIARYTAEDDCAGLPEADQLAIGKPLAALDLYHPWDLTPQSAAKIALRAEKAAFAVDPRIQNSEGASVSAQESHFVLANSRGFCDGYATSSHSLSCAPIAGRGDDMQRDYWWTSECDPADLASPESVGRYAAERALSRLKARKLSTRKCPVLFESPLASGLIGSFTHAISGGALYRKSSFLQDSLGQAVWAAHIDLIEDPDLPKRRGSSPFDSEGVATRKRTLVDGGVLQGYLLGTYSARKLGMQTTGNAGGAHNLLLQSRLTQPQDDLRAMLRKLDTGLFVIELMGHGINYVTGDYSRGAMGFWVEGGKIRYPVQEITIAGNLRDMLRQVIAVGADTHTYGSKTTGSILIDGLTVGGAG